MSASNVEKLLLAGGSDKALRARYNAIETKEKFVEIAGQEGFDFTLEELDAVLREEELSFESSGNPRSRAIWLR